MNIFSLFTDRVIDATKALELEGVDWASVDFSRAVVEPPRDPSHGDLASNVAMVLAKGLGLKPRDFAEQIKQGLEADADIAAVEIAGPGFINIRLHAAFWTCLLYTSPSPRDRG